MAQPPGGAHRAGQPTPAATAAPTPPTTCSSSQWRVEGPGEEWHLAGQPSGPRFRRRPSTRVRRRTWTSPPRRCDCWAFAATARQPGAHARMKRSGLVGRHEPGERSGANEADLMLEASMVAFYPMSNAARSMNWIEISIPPSATRRSSPRSGRCLSSAIIATAGVLRLHGHRHRRHDHRPLSTPIMGAAGIANWTSGRLAQRVVSSVVRRAARGPDGAVHVDPAGNCDLLGNLRISRAHIAGLAGSDRGGGHRFHGRRSPSPDGMWRGSPRVAIAISLVPPLAVVGILRGTGARSPSPPEPGAVPVEHLGHGDGWHLVYTTLGCSSTTAAAKACRRKAYITISVLFVLVAVPLLSNTAPPSALRLDRVLRRPRTSGSPVFRRLDRQRRRWSPATSTSRADTRRGAAGTGLLTSLEDDPEPDPVVITTSVDRRSRPEPWVSSRPQGPSSPPRVSTAHRTSVRISPDQPPGPNSPRSPHPDPPPCAFLHVVPAGRELDPRPAGTMSASAWNVGRRDDRIVGGPATIVGTRIACQVPPVFGEIEGRRVEHRQRAFAIGAGSWEPCSAYKRFRTGPRTTPLPTGQAQQQANTCNGSARKVRPGARWPRSSQQRTKVSSWATDAPQPHLRPNAPPGSRAAGPVRLRPFDGSSPVRDGHSAFEFVADRTAISRRVDPDHPDPCAVSCGASQR